MAIDVNMQLSHMISEGLGTAGTDSAIIDTLSIIKKAATEKELPKLIENTLNIVVSATDIHRGIEHLCNEGRIYKELDSFFLTPSTVEEINELVQKNTSIEESALAQWCDQYSSIIDEQLSDDVIIIVRDSLKRFVCRFFLTHGADCYSLIAGKKEYDEAKAEAIAYEVMDNVLSQHKSAIQSFLTGLFTREFTPEQQSFLLLQFKKAVHYLSMVVNENTKLHLLSALKGLTLYLDTSILYRLFNLQGKQRYDTMRSVVDYCLSSGIELKVLQETVDELKRRIKYDSKVIVEHPIPTSFAAIGYKARTTDNYISTFWNERKTTGITAEDFNFRYSDVISLLGQYSITIDSENYVEEKKLDEQVELLRNKVAEYGTFRDDQKSENAIDHDAICLATVEALQQKNSISALESKVLFLSTDWSLIKLQRTDHDYREKPDFVVLPSQLLQLFSLTTSTVDYYETFIGLFSSTHLSFGTGKLDNEDIQQIMGRVSSYSHNPDLAEHVLSNQLVQAKFTLQETEEAKNSVIDEAILAEIHAMEERISTKDKQLAEKQKALDEKEGQLISSDQKNTVLSAERDALIDELKAVKINVETVTKRNEELETKINAFEAEQRKRKMRKFKVLRVLGVVVTTLGVVLLLFSVLSFIPNIGKITDPVWNYIQPTLESRKLEQSDLMNALLVIGPLLMGGGFALARWSHGKIVGN